MTYGTISSGRLERGKMELDAPSPEYFPASHDSHEAAPAFEYVPPTHAVQLNEPVVEDVPPAQLTQLDAPRLENLPASVTNGAAQVLESGW